MSTPKKCPICGAKFDPITNDPATIVWSYGMGGQDETLPFCQGCFRRAITWAARQAFKEESACG